MNQDQLMYGSIKNEALPRPCLKRGIMDPFVQYIWTNEEEEEA